MINILILVIVIAFLGYMAVLTDRATIGEMYKLIIKIALACACVAILIQFLSSGGAGIDAHLFHK